MTKKPTKPHLACDADLSKIKFPIWGMPKVDGCRAMHITGSLTGRSLKPHANLFITEKYSNPRCTAFDGEMTAGDIKGDSLCRDTTSAVNRIQGEPDVWWNLFDYLREDLIDKPYKERYQELLDFTELHKTWCETMNIRVIPYIVLHNIAAVEAYYMKCLNKGYEGVILRDPEAHHKSGRCTVKEGAYLRLKPSSDKEAKVLRLVEAEQNNNEAKVNELGRTERSSHKENLVGKGMVGMLVCQDLETSMEINVGAGKMTHEERTHYWNNPQEIVGKFIKYKSLDTGVKDKPRHARFMSIRAESDMS